MKLKLRITSIILILLLMQTYFVKIPVSALSTASEAIIFTDGKLEQIIRNTLNKNTGTITVSDMETLENIKIENTNVSNLSGLEYAINLTILRIGNTNIEDFTPIKNLTKLTTLSIWSTENVSTSIDLTVVENLINLKSLYVSNYFIKDIAPISKLINLEIVNFFKNEIEDITPLSELKNLKKVYLYSNKISDISSINKFQSIEDIALGSNDIKDIEPLVKFAESGHRFWEINLSANYLDISKDSDTLKRIQSLSRYCEKIEYDNQKLLFKDDKLRLKIIEALGGNSPSNGVLTTGYLLAIRELNLDDCDINDLTELQYASNLTYLSLNNNNVKTLEPLKYLSGLAVLSAESNYIEDISSLKNITALNYLNLNDNYIDNVEPLRNLTNLQVLGLNANLISDLSPLKALIELQVLDLGSNIISDITDIGNLTNLVAISLQSNNIENIDSLKNMINLQGLDLHNNNVCDISTLDILKSKGAFNWEDSAVGIMYNYLDLTEGSEQEAYGINLQAGGTQVAMEEQFSNLTPKVIFSEPGKGDLGFPIDLPITVQFDKALEAGEYMDYINIVGDAGKIIDLNTTIDNDKVIITPNEKLEYGKRYILQIPLGALKAKADGSISDDFVAVFTTKANDVNKFRVIFNSQGGSIIASNIADYNSIVVTPSTPLKVGYIFGGWYKEAQSINAWNFESDKVTADTTLYAKWTVANKHAITYISNGGSEVQSQLVDHNDKAFKPADPTRGGYKFAGWYIDQYPFSKVFNFYNARITESVTLYSRWIPTEAYIMSYLEQSQDTKLFGVYNQAKAIVFESDLSEVKKGYYLGELAKLDSEVFTQINRYFIDRCNAIAANPNLTDYLALVDEIDSKLTTDIDRGYFKGEMTSWGIYRVYTPQVQASIAAIGQVWTLKTVESVEQAKAAIASVEQAGSVTWLNEQLDEAVEVVSK